MDEMACPNRRGEVLGSEEDAGGDERLARSSPPS